MTREEAKRVLEIHLEHWQRLTKEKICTEQEGTETISAFNMAIKALEQQPILDKIRAEIEDLTYYCWEVSPRTVIDDVLEIIDKHKAESEERYEF